MGYTVRHLMHMDVDTFWRLVFDEDVVRALISKFGNRGGFEVTEDRFDAQGDRHRRIRVWANFEMPSFFKKLIGDGSYTEVGRWDSRQRRYIAECIPNVNADRFGTRYEIIAHPLPGGTTCEREIISDNRARIPGLSGMILGMLEKTQRDSHDQSAAFLNEWARGGGAGPPA